MKTNLFFVLKMLNIILLAIPFLFFWLLYYEEKTTTVGAAQVSILIALTFFTICYYFCQRLDCFKVSVLQIRDIVFGQILAVLITDICMFILIWMLSIHFPNILPMFYVWIIQCGIGAICALLIHRFYFMLHKPYKTIVVYDERVGLEKLINTYRLEKRFEIMAVYAVESIINNLNVVDDMDVVFLCGIHSSERNVIIKHCNFHSIKLFMIPRISDVIMRGSEQIHMLHLPILKNQGYNPTIEYIIIKRVSDIIIAGVALLLLLPIFLLISIAVKSDGGATFYKQKRLTKDGKVFEILKFRSMRIDAEKLTGAVLSSGKHDLRITKVGSIIRKYRLDELPQLFNILKGDMSLVGPRPERPELQTIIEKQVPEFKLRLQAKAGLTGYAQVYGKYNTTFYDKLLMDLMYMSNPGILEDLTLILATIKILTMNESSEGTGECSNSLEYRQKNV